ncbi:bifunctional histidinol-phosphatase/imidazoleglycerol-phosphate dehydratase HisB [Buchnera aphidicola]|uniref:Histidine biosynthesis bifunctional protein HisB n=1 Tax=Buchnera aphidicola str. USDA (Myzus persicae) TaxID=1009856 RepID=W0P496_BUCMP|nr:bifunctional histidinol-phosphatase/imidazoleglycerol-phosphate dehydratase HisB [Buchnera aphidicola]AHG60267.1 Hisb [Buchnera aphidicola str. USDA (Myzus persicae)]AHG60845.1 Hisb [Buchnera aphidicola str. W106 (Myzus persicae)]AHG61417.1 Hisb [Buchnera aphidicola str. G002 (Myzus persicae)]AHG61990.1 Hisb [Buchnera aphidicola str. F009 (Myzus persicae)]WAI03046.1 MAG: bifunctional histidinol-phosphatase/imidazoleglycerol-phosphate dehydratase HisB [Buchnera aphidicola (Myzus persicae)]
MKEKILFIDRDGTLIDEPIKDCQVDEITKLVFKKNVISSLFKLIQLNYKLIMITNQDGLGSEKFPWVNFNIPHSFMLNIFRNEGIIFEDVLICPHFLEDNCECRKPKTKMIEPWLNKIDLKHSYVIGDRDTDLEMAKKIQVTGIKYKENTFNWIHIEKEIIKKNRYSEIFRETKETKINVQVWLDLEEHSKINTGIKFFDHMLEQLSIHSGICMHIVAKGDLHIDDHHTVEDIGIVLGEALLESLGQKKGLSRFGFYLPMDESRANCIIDISNRPYLKFQANFKHKMVGDLSTNMIEHFFYSLCYSMKITLHLFSEGTNDHHCAESIFKVFGRALRQAIKIEGNMLPTSKGIL